MKQQFFRDFTFCRCDVLVHEECLKTTIQTVRTHRSVCHVCKTPYPAVIHVVTKKKIDKYAFATWGLYMASCCFGVLCSLFKRLQSLPWDYHFYVHLCILYNRWCMYMHLEYVLSLSSLASCT